MKVAIWGAGGIGCYYGARLQQAGHDVLFIARGAHLKAMQQKGLKVEHETLEFDQPVDALSQEQWLQEHHCSEFDLIILAIKAGATSELMNASKAWLEEGSCQILSLQNGVENEALIAQTVGAERTLGGLAVRIGGHILEPGHVQARGVAQVVFGQWPNQPEQELCGGSVEALRSTLKDAAIEAILSTDIRRELWRKLLINNGVNPLSALTGLDTRQLTAHPVHGQVVYKMMEEAAQAANIEGVALGQQDIDEMFKLISEFDAIKTSMLVDREKGRPLELDGITGAVLRRCHQGSGDALMTGFITELLKSEYDCD